MPRDLKKNKKHLFDYSWTIMSKYLKKCPMRTHIDPISHDFQLGRSHEYSMTQH